MRSLMKPLRACLKGDFGWKAYSVPFFDEDTEPTGLPPQTWKPRPVWMAQPSNWLPCHLSLSGLLARNDRAAVEFWGAQLTPHGFGFRVTVRSRVADPPHVESRRRDVQPWKLGIRLPDGQKAVHGQRPSANASGEPARPVLANTGGGVSSFTIGQASLWLWPLPPGPSIDLVFAWPSMDIEEHEVSVDTSEWAGLAANAVELWPAAPEVPDKGSFFLPATR